MEELYLKEIELEDENAIIEYINEFVWILYFGVKNGYYWTSEKRNIKEK